MKIAVTRPGHALCFLIQLFTHIKTWIRCSKRCYHCENTIWAVSFTRAESALTQIRKYFCISKWFRKYLTVKSNKTTLSSSKLSRNTTIYASSKFNEGNLFQQVFQLQGSLFQQVCQIQETIYYVDKTILLQYVWYLFLYIECLFLIYTTINQFYLPITWPTDRNKFN